MKKAVRSKVVNLESVIAGRAAAEELQRTVATTERLVGFHPAHAAYVYAQHQVSVMSEQLTPLDQMVPFANVVSKAEDLYISDWQRKGATLSDKTARKEFGLTGDEIVQAIRAGTLQYRVGSVYGNRFFRLLRREVEALVKQKHGDDYLKDQQAKTELKASTAS